MIIVVLRVIKLNQMRDCIIKILSEFDYKDEKLYLRVLSSIDDVSLLFIDGSLENLGLEIINLRVTNITLIMLRKIIQA